MKKFFKISGIILAIVIVLCIILVGYIGITAYNSFDINKITDVKQTLFIYDKNSNAVADVYDNENRTWVTIDKIPQHVKNAFIAVEDVRFYDHPGFDIKRIFGSMLTNVKSGGIKEGASTITQQLIKLSHLYSDQTIERKLKEIFLSLRIENEYTKDEILEMYLNYVYFGNGAYGIQTAAMNYFGVDVSELTVSQGAMLAATLKSPSNYAPHIELENNTKRRDLILKLMKKENFISEQEYIKSMAETPAITNHPISSYPHGYFVDATLQECEKILGKNQEDIQDEGLKIYTTLDVDIQNNLEDIANNKENLPVNKDETTPELALVTLDSKTGGVLGVVGGKEHKSRRVFNRAVDMKRQPGSAIKPILVYAPAIEQKGYSPATLVLDEKTDFNGYMPSNYDDKYRGWTTVRNALTNSLNVSAVKIFKDIGVDTGIDYAKSVGIPFLDADKNLGLALGGFSTGVSPINLGGSYIPFANNGNYNSPHFITKIENHNGQVLFQRVDENKKVLSEETAFIMTNMLKDVVKKGTGKTVGELNFNIAGKTGTVNMQNSKDNKDAWMVGYSTDYVCVSWIGYDNPSETNKLQSGVTGGSYPAKMIKQFFTGAYTNKPPKDFDKPDGVTLMEIDLKALKDKREVLLANPYTPKEYVLQEYFTKKTIPKKITEDWQSPTPVSDLKVNLDNNGYPVISFTTGSSNIKYYLIREENGLAYKIDDLMGKDKIVKITDTAVKDKKIYNYYVIAELPKKHGNNMERVTSKKISIEIKDINKSKFNDDNIEIFKGL